MGPDLRPCEWLLEGEFSWGRSPLFPEAFSFAGEGNVVTEGDIGLSVTHLQGRACATKVLGPLPSSLYGEMWGLIIPPHYPPGCSGLVLITKAVRKTGKGWI